MQRTIHFLACLLITLTGATQQYPFVHYTPREGLVNNRAKYLFQDSRGKLYISTFGGLSIYDGTRFTNYSMNNGLATPDVNAIVEMGDDSIWIVPNTNKVQYLVHGRLKEFIPTDNFTPLINQLFKCYDGFYYAIADEGLFRLENKRFIKIDLSTPLSNAPIKTLIQAVEVDQKLYILSNPDYKLMDANLVVYDLMQKKILAYHTTTPIRTLFSPTGNEVWATTQKGMFMLEKPAKENDPVLFKAIPDSFHLPKNINPNVVYKDRQDNLWLTDPYGVYRISPEGETNLFTVENGLTKNFQTSIFQDFENNMWFTNEQTGLSKLSNQQLAFFTEIKKDFYATDIFVQPSNDTVWMHDTYHHRILLILPDGHTEEYTFPAERLPFIAKFVRGRHRWLLSGNRIFQLNLDPTSKHYSLSLFYTDSTNPIGFSCGMSDKHGNLVAVSDKLVVITGNKILSHPINYMADQLTIDENNRIWVAHRGNHLFCFEIAGAGDSAKLTLLKDLYSVAPGSPRSIAADKSGNIWLGTRDQGVYCIHFDGLNVGSVRKLTTVNGLSENFVNYLYCDKDNNIWSCTHSGVDKIRIHNNNFLIENITRGNNLYLPITKIQQTAKGLFWISSTDGIIRYDPARLTRNNWKPQLLFSNIIINNAANLDMPADNELSYRQNNLVFQLAVPTFIDEKQTRFSYFLEGSGNENWSAPSADASINFVNLPPGNYTLRAKANFLHGLYPDAELSYSFTILPPWWQTWWFKTLFVFLLVGLLLLGLRYYIKRKLQLQQMMLEKKRAVEKERTRIATDMHDDLGAGLSQIKFLSETIGMKKQQHLPIEEEISSIRTFSHEMIDKMGEIVWALNEKNDTLNDLLAYTRAYAVEYLQQNGITCRVKQPEHLPQGYVSSEFRRNIYLTVKETLHNIVKHAQATEVFIIISISDKLNIQIQDNGIGIKNVRSRTGNGLINMNNRIQALEGRFEIVNNNGTRVNIEVPLDV